MRQLRLAANTPAVMRDTDSTNHILARSEHYTVSHEYETVYLNLPSGKRVVIGDFYRDPEAAAIDADEKWTVVVGCGLILYRLRPPFEEYEHNTSSDQWWEAHRDPPTQWWIESVYQASPNAVRFVVDPAAANAGVYQLDVDSLSIERINLGFESA